MKAARVHRFGGPDAIVLDETAVPTPEAGEILVRVKAAGVGNWDALARSGRIGIPLTLPVTLGAEISGVVESVGPGVSDSQSGDEVFGAANARFLGGYAQYAMAVASMIAGKPQSLTFVEAASVPIVAVTAHEMLFDYAQVAAGQTVLVHGGAGVSRPDEAQAARYGVRTAYLIVSVATEDLAHLARLIDAKELRTSIGVVLPLSEARRAHEMLDGLVPHPRGKIVLQVAT